MYIPVVGDSVVSQVEGLGEVKLVDDIPVIPYSVYVQFASGVSRWQFTEQYYCPDCVQKGRELGYLVEPVK